MTTFKKLSSSVINIVMAKFVTGSTIQITFGFSPFDSRSSEAGIRALCGFNNYGK
jgi:hypothetical protein